jgi:DNA-binding MltR family transcriptional regulator
MGGVRWWAERARFVHAVLRLAPTSFALFHSWSPEMPESTFKKFADEIKVIVESEPHGPENQLTAALKITFRKDDDTWKELFRLGAPITAFRPKAQLACMLRIINKTQYKDIDRIVKIRNKLAHDVDVSSFDDQPVRDWISVLTTRPSYEKFCNQAVEKYGDREHLAVYNGIIIRKDSLRSQFQWAARYYFDLLSIYEINTVGVSLKGDSFSKIEMREPTI